MTMIVKEEETNLTVPAAPRIKDMDADDTPRERAEKHGCAALSVPDLWALILRTGTVGNPITALCRDLMRANDGKLTRLERRTRRELLQIKGLGKLKVIQIEAVMELIRRYNREEAEANPVIKGSEAIFRVMRPHLGHLDHEEVWALIMNRRNEVVKLYQVSKGGIASSVFDVKLIVKEALLENAACIALCHNHPSGNLQPSPQDDQITRRCKEACQLMDLRLLDHLIITADNTRYYSYFDNGRL
ncbi:MAG: DNA repair protein RadC [Bacteroidales bacterium]|nr:DNA repair protein RadC [Bacteroidales bacterium]